VKTAANGVVAYAGDELKGYGKLVLISHGNGWVTAYAFNSKLLVKRWDQVRQGQSVALVGHNVDTFSQLHFEIRRGSQPLNPLDYLPNR
jgi:murein DD-endopeptidase MepM/ murein hydrolase activator NlpD